MTLNEERATAESFLDQIVAGRIAGVDQPQGPQASLNLTPCRECGNDEYALGDSSSSVPLNLPSFAHFFQAAWSQSAPARNLDLRGTTRQLPATEVKRESINSIARGKPERENPGPDAGSPAPRSAAWGLAEISGSRAGRMRELAISISTTVSKSCDQYELRLRSTPRTPIAIPATDCRKLRTLCQSPSRMHRELHRECASTRIRTRCPMRSMSVQWLFRIAALPVCPGTGRNTRRNWLSTGRRRTAEE